MRLLKLSRFIGIWTLLGVATACGGPFATSTESPPTVSVPLAITPTLEASATAESLPGATAGVSPAVSTPTPILAPKETMGPSIAPTALGPLVKIMPLGDSITQSYSGFATYRYWLWHQLVDAGYAVNFVGSMTKPHGGEPLYTDFDMDHEGHGGWFADELVEQVYTWASLADPDVVLLHIGTNDLRSSETPESTANDTRRIIDLLRSAKPQMAILLAQIIPTDSLGQAGVPAYNTLLEEISKTLSTAESPIVLVDQYSGFDVTTETVDGVHPNETGEKHIAERWFNGLVELLGPP